MAVDGAYLWITQYRVYAQGIGKTTLKSLLLDGLYGAMVMLASSLLVAMRLYHG
ncbi:MAG: hypothetical protein QM599_10190 [Pseudoxanthomonas sp.]